MDSIKKIASQIKLLILDCDGVLTDGKIYIDAEGRETVAFFVRDGLGIERLQKNGVAVAVISGRNNPAVRHRLTKLNVAHIHLGHHEEKLSVFRSLLNTLAISPEQVAYVGDDYPDIVVMREVGLPIAVADAILSVKNIAQYCTQHNGGQGAVREVCDLIYDAQHEA